MRENIIKFTIRGVALVVLAVFGYIIIAGLSNKNDKKEKTIIQKKKDSTFTKKISQDTVLEINKHKVFVKISSDTAPKGTFLVLQGWNLGAEEWCTKTQLCEKAKAKGYHLVLPDMGKSVYSSRYFPETRKEWMVYPTRTWVTDTLIPELQKTYGLFAKNQRNFIVGLSTGARGVALIALDMPDLFRGAAALSGDYDQTKMPADNLMTGFYGPYASFKSRWETIDNAMYRIKEYNVPTYLGHGKLDKVVPPQQTEMFYAALKKNHPELKVALSMPDAKHDYDFWSSEVDKFLLFFDEIK
jgi:S-formylglutathione hydrolase FrmB